MGVGEELGPILRGIQNQLFHLGAELSLPSAGEDAPEGPRIRAQAIDDLEAHIDRMNEGLGPLENFILPGGSSTAAGLQVARAICRRAERRVVTLNREQPLRDTVMRYINRLSDALFVFARYENARRGVDEPLWDSRA
jgi:cob(I)alamin adenosyltransferase